MRIKLIICLVLGCFRFLHRHRELRQHRILVPLLLCFQVRLPPVALSAHVPVRHFI